MVETKIPKEIRTYKTKVVGPFTLRQVLCIAACTVVDALVYALIHSLFDLPLNALIYVIIFLDLPILSFIMEPRGMPMEVFLRDVVLRNFRMPAKRRAKTELVKYNVKKLSEKELKTREKKLAKQYKVFPECKPYR